MASIKSPFRTLLKPILFKLLGKKGYVWAQYYAKRKDIKGRLVEEIEMELLPQIVKDNDEVLDIGANFAYYTERLSRLVPNGHVYAFEPIPFTHKVADMLVRKFRLKNVSLFRKGVGQKSETLRFSVPKMGFGSISAGQAHVSSRNNDLVKGTSYFVSEQNEEFDCEVVDIDTFLLPRLKNLTFVKLDIEGAEYLALKGMEKTLSKFSPLILIEIVPIFLKGFAVEPPFFKNYIEQDLQYAIYYYSKEEKKLLPLTESTFTDRNYVLIPKSKLAHYKTLIA